MSSLCGSIYPMFIMQFYASNQISYIMRMFGLLFFLASVLYPAAAQAPAEPEAVMEEGSEASVVVEQPQAPAAPAKPAKRSGKKRKAKQKQVKAHPVSPAPAPAAPVVQEKKAEVKPEPAKSSEPVVPATGITPSNP